MSTFQQSRKEDMSEFFREPNREKLREILRSYDGEYNRIDFKKEWIDQAKLAKHVLAFANSGGGVMVFGVAEGDDNSVNIEGLDELMDKSDLALDQYLPDAARGIYEVEDYDYGRAEWEEIEESLFQVLFVNDVPELLPIVSNKRADGRIEADTIYVRRNTKSVAANQTEINNLVERRVKTQFREKSGDLRKELNQLQVLYDNLPDKRTEIKLHREEDRLNRGLTDQLLPGQRREFYEYVGGLIDKKESQIENLLGIQ